MKASSYPSRGRGKEEVKCEFYSFLILLNLKKKDKKMKRFVWVLAVCALVGMSSCERVKKASTGKQKRIVQAEAVINMEYMAGDWVDGKKNDVITLGASGDMSGKVGGTVYSEWIVAHEKMLLFRGERGGQEVIDTDMLNVDVMPEELTVAATGNVYAKKHEK